MELEGYETSHLHSEEDTVMALKNGDLRLSIQNFETLFKRFIVNEKIRMSTDLSTDLNSVPEMLRYDHWTKVFGKMIDAESIEPLTELRRNEITKKLIEAYEKDKKN